MKIKYILLWFENDIDWAISKKDFLKSIIEENGFEWVEPSIYKTETEFSGKYNDYDLILVDYKLVDGATAGKQGSDIIAKIRSADCLTNIMFYSQHGEKPLRIEIASKGLDGVFCVDRREFVDRFEQIFITNIKKIEDVNNLRGLVMAETADLESLKEKIIKKYDDASCPEKKKIIKELLKNMKASSSKNTVFLESKIADENTSFNELLDIFDFTKKSIIVHQINHRNKSPVGVFIFDDFKNDIIIKRNLLAHVIEKRNELGEVFLESEKTGPAKLVFTQDEAKRIRQDITKYRIELEKILKSI
jgi:hypothetical protein